MLETIRPARRASRQTLTHRRRYLYRSIGGLGAHADINNDLIVNSLIACYTPAESHYEIEISSNLAAPDCHPSLCFKMRSGR